MSPWAESVPPFLAIICVALMEWFFPEKIATEEIAAFKTDFASEANFPNLHRTMLHLMRGWQSIIDLLYALFAFGTVMLCRFVEGTLQQGLLVLPLLAISTLVDIMLLCRCSSIGPSQAAAIPVKIWFSQRRLTFSQVIKIFVIGSNVLLILAIGADHILFRKDSMHSSAHSSAPTLQSTKQPH